MKITVALLFVSILISGCSSIKSRFVNRRAQKSQQKIDNQVKPKRKFTIIEVPKFDNIENYLKASYAQTSLDKIRRIEYINNSPDLDIVTKELILNGKIREGMYKEEILASIGAPDNRIKNITDFGMKEKWIYKNMILHLENGILKIIEKI